MARGKDNPQSCLPMTMAGIVLPHQLLSLLPRNKYRTTASCPLEYTNTKRMLLSIHVHRVSSCTIKERKLVILDIMREEDRKIH